MALLLLAIALAGGIRDGANDSGSRNGVGSLAEHGAILSAQPEHRAPVRFVRQESCAEDGRWHVGGEAGLRSLLDKGGSGCTGGGSLDALDHAQRLAPLASTASEAGAVPEAVEAGAEHGALSTQVLPLSEVEALICSVGFPDCQKALRVARCESGPDYSAPFDGVHAGPFQVAEAYHADKFTAHGWDYYTDGNDPYRNSVVALEILASAGYVWTGHWPHCGWN